MKNLLLLLLLFLFSCSQCPDLKLGDYEIMLIEGEISGDEYRELVRDREIIKKMRKL